jgi:hypothetical protein
MWNSRGASAQRARSSKLPSRAALHIQGVRPGPAKGNWTQLRRGGGLDRSTEREELTGLFPKLAEELVD